MKFLTKSKLGASIAGAYLLLVFFLLMATAFGGEGLHSGAAMAALFVVMLTFPLSRAALRILDFLNPAPAYEQAAFLVSLAVCAVIYAGVIYLAVGFVSRASRALLRKLLR